MYITHQVSISLSLVPGGPDFTLSLYIDSFIPYSDLSWSDLIVYNICVLCYEFKDLNMHINKVCLLLRVA